MKKIAFYIESLIGGGAEKQLIDLVNHLDYTQYEVTVIAIFEQSVYDNYDFRFDTQFNNNVRYLTLVNNKSGFLYRLFNRAFAHLPKQWVYGFLVKEKYDVEIAYYEGLPTEFVAFSNNVKSKKYTWLHTDNHRLYRDSSDKIKQYAAEIYSKFNCVIGVSDYVCKTFNYYFPNISTKVIKNGIDNERIIRLLQENCPILKTEEMVFLTVGRMTQVKGYLRLLKVFERLHDSGYLFKLVMIGEGEELEKLKEFAIAKNLNDDIVFAGAKNNPYKYMKNADYFVCSSYFEGYSLTIAEAISCNLPVLSTDCGVQREVFGENECGIICDNNEESMYQMIEYALQHPDLREHFVEECKLRKNELSLCHTVEEFIHLVNEEK